MVPMVKADAYGLGMARTVSTLEPLDPWAYGVAAVSEGAALRELEIRKPVLVCSPVPPGSYHGAVRARLTVTISALEGLDRLRETARRLGTRGRFHLEVDTGMGRAGLDWREVEAWAPVLEERLGPDLMWEGCFTHFHSADEVDPEPTTRQWSRLREVLDRLAFRPGNLLIHACNSPGALRRPDFAADAVRPGIFLYGGGAGEGLPTPASVAALRARIVLLKEVAPGITVGYGATYRAPGRERWATVAIGYGDGLPRLLSNRGEALVKGVRVPIVGRISMDVTVLNVTDVPGVVVGDVATFFGVADGGEIRVDDVADHARTISYEILTGLTPRVPRIWIDDVGY